MVGSCDTPLVRGQYAAGYKVRFSSQPSLSYLVKYTTFALPPLLCFGYIALPNYNIIVVRGGLHTRPFQMQIFCERHKLGARLLLQTLHTILTTIHLVDQCKSSPYVCSALPRSPNTNVEPLAADKSYINHLVHPSSS